MPKDSSDRYYQNNKERLPYKNLPEMKNKSLYRKKYFKMRKNTLL